MAQLMDERKSTENLDPGIAVASDSVESGILPLVRALNEIPSCSTIASCHGHRPLLPLFGRTSQHPYVLFRAPTDCARSLSMWLGHGKGPAGQLSFVWRLDGYFHPPAFKEFVWVLRADDLRLDQAWGRARINEDVEQLSATVKQLWGPATYSQ